MLTLNQIKEYLIQFFNNHWQINTVVYADDFDFSAKADVQYKVAHIQPVDPSSVNANEITYKFKIAIGDIEDPNNMDSENDIWSDCISIANDFITYFGNDDFEDFFIDKNITIQKFSEGNTDRVAGVVFAFGVRQERLNNPCTLPLINPLSGVSFTGNIVYPNAYYNLLQPYLTILSASSLYQPIGNYLTGATVDLTDYYTKEQSNSLFLTGYTVDFSDYYTKEQSNSLFLTGFTVDLSGYQLKGDYVSASTLSGYQLAGNYVSASTLNNYQLSGNYVSASTLSQYVLLTGLTSYYTKTQSDAKYLTGLTATTLAGYGITDAYTKTQSDSKYLTGYTLTATTLAGYGISSGDTLFDKKYIINFNPISANTLYVSGLSLFQQSNLGTTSTDGLILSNNTPANSAATVQYSPRLRFNTHVWNSTATAADNQFDFINELRPVSAAVPSGKLFWAARESVSGTSSFIDVMNLDNSGNLTVTGGFTAGSNTTISGSITIQNNTVTTSVLANNNVALNFQNGRAYSTAINAIAVYANGATITNSSGLFGGIVFTPTYNQTGSASSTDILINRTETSVGSGNQLFINAQVSGTSRFIVDHLGNITGNTLTLISGTTTTSGGTPSALVGLSAITGSASTFLRSDAAPAINQAITPTWTGLHTWNNSITASTGTGVGQSFTPTISPSAIGDTLVALDVAPSYGTGFTGSNNLAVRMTGRPSAGKIFGTLITDSAFNYCTILIGSLMDGGGTFSIPGIWMNSLYTNAPSETNFLFNLDNGNGGCILNGPSTFNPISLRTNNITRAQITTGGLFWGTLLNKPSSLSAINTSVTGTSAQFGTGVITCNASTPINIVTPTATALATQIGATQGTSFDSVVDNSTGTNTVTLILNLGITALGVITGGNNLSVSSGSTGHFRWYFKSATAASFMRLG